MLARICTFFKVDARVLLEPVDQIGGGQDPIANPYLRNYVGPAARDVPFENFPDGFFRFSRRSFVNTDIFVVGLVRVHREGENTFLRGFETKEAMRMQYLPTDIRAREFRGLVMQQEDGIAIVASRKNAMTSSFNYLARTASFENNFWVGYVTRTVPETAGGLRATRLVYEHLGNAFKDALAAARSAGFCEIDDVPPFHRRHLQTEKPFF